MKPLGHLLICASLAIGLPLGSAEAQKPSFDCAKAQRPVEVLICGNPVLSRLDGYLGRVFSDAYAALPLDARDAFFRAQIGWIKRRNAACQVGTDFSSNEIGKLERTDCLVRWTLARVIVLAGRYRAISGRDHPIAETLGQDVVDGTLSPKQ